MTYETAISALDAARNGAEILEVLDTLVTKDHVLSPTLVQQALTGGLHRNIDAVPMLEPMEF
jgi:hypothetical protein